MNESQLRAAEHEANREPEYGECGVDYPHRWKRIGELPDGTILRVCKECKAEDEQ